MSVPFYASESEDELLTACGPCTSRLKPHARPKQLSGKKLSRILGCPNLDRMGFMMIVAILKQLKKVEMKLSATRNRRTVCKCICDFCNFQWAVKH